MSLSAPRDMNIGQKIKECKDMVRSTLIQMRKAFDVDTANSFSDALMRDLNKIYDGLHAEAIAEPVHIPNKVSELVIPNDEGNVNNRIKIKSENKIIVIDDSDDESIVEIKMGQEVDETKECMQTETALATTSKSTHFNPGSIKNGKRNDIVNSKSGNQQGAATCMRKSKKTGPLTCERCLKIFRSSPKLIFHRRLYLHSSSIHCNGCLLQFTTMDRKNTHEKYCNARRYECHLCGLLSEHISKLKRHMTIHTGIKA